MKNLNIYFLCLFIISFPILTIGQTVTRSNGVSKANSLESIIKSFPIDSVSKEVKFEQVISDNNSTKVHYLNALAILSDLHAQNIKESKAEGLVIGNVSYGTAFFNVRIYCKEKKYKYVISNIHIGDETTVPTALYIQRAKQSEGEIAKIMQSTLETLYADLMQSIDKIKVKMSGKSESFF